MTEEQKTATADMVERAAYRYWEASMEAASARASYMLAMTMHSGPPPIPESHRPEPPDSAEPAPVEVPMRVRAVNPTGHAVDTRYTWDSQLARMWLERHNRDLYAGWHTKERAIAGGSEWLRDLSAQLGVPLKAVWEGEVEAAE